MVHPLFDAFSSSGAVGPQAALIGEAITGKGPLAQASLETGIPLSQAPPLLLAFIGFTFIGAFTSGLGSKGYQEADPFQPAKAGNLRGVFGLAEKGKPTQLPQCYPSSGE